MPCLFPQIGPNIRLRGGYKSLEEIEATGLRGTIPWQNRLTIRLSGAWKSAAGPTGYDFMTPFTKTSGILKEINVRHITLEVLASYGDSTSVLIDEPILRQNQVKGFWLHRQLYLAFLFGRFICELYICIYLKNKVI